ncbi:MAG TPA: HAMP domain-containing sensor histidine kinase [Planctomycetota bacterium]|jgi:signal transduction histidine kinase
MIEVIVSCAGCGRRYKGIPWQALRCAGCGNVLTFPVGTREAPDGQVLCSNCWSRLEQRTDLTQCPSCGQRVSPCHGGHAAPWIFGSCLALAIDELPRSAAPGIGPTLDEATGVAPRGERQISFLAAVAHDMRSALHPLKLSAVLIDRHLQRLGATQLSEPCAVIKRQVAYLDRMLDDLLDVLLVESGHLELKLEHKDLREIVRSVAELCSSGPAQRAVCVSLPPQPVIARCDPMRAEQILSNLINNALKYSPAETAVCVTLEHRGSEAVLSVADEGAGIAPEDQKRLFEPFMRFGSATSRVAGTGLGLSVVKRLVESHRGRVEVDSAPGRGSTFRVILPVEPAVAFPEACAC